MNHFKIMLVMSICLGTTACSKSSSDNSASAAAASAPFVNEGPEVTASELQGTWLGQCGLNISAAGNSEVQYSLNFSGTNQAQFTVNNFASTTSCAGPAAISTVLQATYSLQGLSASINGATMATVTVQSAQMTPANATYAAAMNAEALCGKTNWQGGVTMTLDITNPCVTQALTASQIMQIAGTNLYFGNSDNSAINTQTAYLKQ